MMKMIRMIRFIAATSMSTRRQRGSLLFTSRWLRRMRRTARAAESLLVELVVNAGPLRRLLSGQVSGQGRQFILVVFVAKLRGAVTRADRQIYALAASVAIGELAI